jgi:hypothetical protein
MKKSVGLWIVLLLVALGFSWVVGCRDDVLVPFPPSLLGNYHGTYQYQAVVGIDTQENEIAPITFKFTSGDFNMYKDSTIPESLRIFCDVAGEYSLEDGVLMTLTDSSLTPVTCFLNWGPNGFFGLDQTTDSVKLTQVRNEGGTEITTRIRLLID